MKLITSRSGSLSGETRLPGDKSLSHRAALFAALADGESHIENFLVAGVTRVMLGALSALGVDYTLDGNALTVQGHGFSSFRNQDQFLDCGNSATTIRLLAGALAATGVSATLDGTSGLRARPMERLVNPLRRMGVPLSMTASGTAPLQLEARPAGEPLRAIDYELPVASAQIKSAILLAALGADGVTVVHEPGPLRDHTERMLRGMGVQVASQGGRILLTPPMALNPLDFTVPGDISSAAFLIVAALIIPDSEITLRGIGLNPTRTGLLDALMQMEADIQIEPKGEQGGELVGDITIRHSELKATQVEGSLVVRMIDEFPIFAVAAACAQGETVVRGARELRYKESDRISALCQELNRIGVDVTETEDGFTIRGGRPLVGGVADAHGDHRLAMSLAVAGLASERMVVIPDAEYITESFPGFSSLLMQMGGSMTLASTSALRSA